MRIDIEMDGNACFAVFCICIAIIVSIAIYFGTQYYSDKVEKMDPVALRINAINDAFIPKEDKVRLINTVLSGPSAEQEPALEKSE